jgi:hypothetical protein
MTASNITYDCLALKSSIRYRVAEKKLNDMVLNEEITLHHIFFFFGKVMVGAGPAVYFDGAEKNF